jgi:uncharacterized membrane protein
MTGELRESETNSRKQAIMMWRAMSVGPVAFFLWLLAIGLLLLLISRGVAPDWLFTLDPEREIPIGGAILAEIVAGVGPFLVVAGAEIVGAMVAYSMRRKLAGTSLESHATSAIRTFWIMVGGVVVTICLSLALLAIPNIGAVGFGVGVIFILLFAIPMLFLWKAFRVFRDLRRARDGLPIADRPTRWS